MPYQLEPQVAGELGDDTVMDVSVHPPLVSRVAYELDQPDNDDLIQSFPVYLVERSMADQLVRAGLTGFDLAAAVVRPGEEYEAEYQGKAHKDYVWLRVHGTNQHDCWIDHTLMLCVSDAMMAVLKSGQLEGCDVVPVSS